MATNQTWSG